LIATAMLVGAAACAAFSEDTASPPVAVDPDGAADGAADASDAMPFDAPADASAPDVDESKLRMLCPPANGGTTLATAWITRTLFAPPKGERMYPFAIASDSTHVTWLAQVGTSDGGADTVPYNGGGSAVVMRMGKAGLGKPAVLAHDQMRATALALDGAKVYWTTYEGNRSTLRAQRRDIACGAVCPEPETILTFDPNVRIVRLIRPASKVLFALAESGQVYRVGLGTAAQYIFQSGTYPAITATANHVYTSAGLSPNLERVQVDGLLPEPTYYTFPPVAGGGVGVSPIATDCTTLWMVRGYPDGRHIVGRELLSGTVSQLTILGQVDAYDLAADARYVYTAAANGGGIYAVDTTTKITEHPYSGNVFGLAVDDDGVYFGEHDPNGGAGTIKMLVKK